MNFNKIEAGDIVEYEGLWYTVLGHSASKDEDGNRFVEICYDEYLAVSEKDLKLKAKCGTYI